MSEVVGENESRVNWVVSLLEDPRLLICVDKLIKLEELKSLKKSPGLEMEIESMNDRLERDIEQFIDFVGDREVALAAIYRKTAIGGLESVLEYFSGDEYQSLICACRHSMDSGESIMDASRAEEILHNSSSKFVALNCVGFDRPSADNGLNKSPFYSGPFKEIDPKDPVWRENLEVGENFHHALYNLYDLHTVSLMAPCVCSGDYDYSDFLINALRINFEAISGVLNVFAAFKKKLEGVFDKESVFADDVVWNVKALLNRRFADQFEISQLPVSFEGIKEGTVINNVDKDALAVVAWEMIKNAFRDGKIASKDIKGFDERREAYLSVSAGDALINGKDVVVFEIRDKGAHINIMEVIKKLGPEVFGYDARDITLGEILDTLSRRHLSIPLEDGGSMYTGIGLHSAREIIKSFNGEIFSANLEDGVGFLIVIPKEGAESGWNVSEMKVSGLECQELADLIAAYQEEFARMLLMIAAVSTMTKRQHV